MCFDDKLKYNYSLIFRKMLTKILFASLLVSLSLGRSTKAPKTQLNPEINVEEEPVIFPGKPIEDNEDDSDMELESDVNIYDYGIGEPILDVISLEDVIESRKKVQDELKALHVKREQEALQDQHEMYKIAESNQENENTQKPTINPRAETQVTLEDIVRSKDTIIAKLKTQIQKRDNKIHQLKENLENVIEEHIQ
jgi:hypothetical protein